jgi:hypothetical protein
MDATSPRTKRLLCSEEMPEKKPRFTLISARRADSAVYLLENNKAKLLEYVHYTPPSVQFKETIVCFRPPVMKASPVVKYSADDSDLLENLPAFDMKYFEDEEATTCVCDGITQLPELDTSDMYDGLLLPLQSNDASFDMYED